MSENSYTIWFTGMPCSGKTTIASALFNELKSQGIRHIYHLDGDVVRSGLCNGLGFSILDRMENLHRISEVSRMMNEAGVLVLASFVSPDEQMRSMVKSTIPNLSMVYVKCSTEECEKRDVKGMWKKARMGEIKDFTGVDSEFQEPNDPDLILDTINMSLEECVEKSLALISKLNIKQV